MADETTKRNETIDELEKDLASKAQDAAKRTTRTFIEAVKKDPEAVKAIEEYVTELLRAKQETNKKISAKLAKFKKELATMSTEDKVAIIVDSQRRKKMLDEEKYSEQEIELIYGSVEGEQKKAFYRYINAINGILYRRTSIHYYSALIKYRVSELNRLLMALDIVREEAYHYMELITILNEASLIGAYPIKHRLEEWIKSNKTNCTGIKICYNEQKQTITLEADKWVSYIKTAIEDLKTALCYGKTIALSLEEYVKEQHIEKLVPEDIKEKVESYGKDYAKNKLYSGEEYKRLFHSRDERDQQTAMHIEDNIGLDIIFPSYEDIEPLPNWREKNLFYMR